MRMVFEGIKVADFSSALVGPVAAQYLALHGALVIKVESKKFGSITRTTHPFKDGITHPDRAALFAGREINKYGLTLDLTSIKGREVAYRLVKWADILVQNSIIEQSKKLGMDYDSLKQINPELIVASTTQMGQSGPWSAFKGFGMHGAAMAGFGSVVGYSKEEPRLPFGAYTDGVGCRYLAIAIIVALLHRRKTGRGQYIDQSQVESTLPYLSLAILDYVVNKRVAQPMGNQEFHAVPHNAYRCRGDDRWCVIAIYTDEEWQSFCQAIDKPSWCLDPGFATLLGRKKNEQELDRLVESWTRNYSPEEVMQILQQSGVAAGIVPRGEDVHNDPQLKYRNHFWISNHPVIGPHTADAPGFRLSATPAQYRSPGPCLGQHNHYVCTELLGMSEEEFAEFEQAGTFV